MIFLDFEATSLASGSTPIEVAWCSHDLRRGWSALIKPCLGWTDWSVMAERLHGISQSRLDADGLMADDVMRRLNADLAAAPPVKCVSDNPEFDRRWLARLADGAAVGVAFSIEPIPLDGLLAGARIRAGLTLGDEVHPLAAKRMADDAGLIDHRALPDVIRHAFRHAAIMLAQVDLEAGEAPGGTPMPRSERALEMREILLKRARKLMAELGRDNTRKGGLNV